MEPKIDPKELAEIVEETARIRERESALLSQEQAREVLSELDLPADRLEAARAAVATRRALARESANRLKLAGGFALFAVVVLALVGWRAHARNGVMARMSTSQATLMVSGVPLASPVSRSAQPEVRFEAVLAHPPQGSSLELACDWLGPEGNVVYQNRWQTKDIDKEAWPTHCRHLFNPADPAGVWSVKMKLGDRTLATEGFSLE